ncbi:hypothetical protein ABK040_012245 [Willaertia magna]
MDEHPKEFLIRNEISEDDDYNTFHIPTSSSSEQKKKVTATTLLKKKELLKKTNKNTIDLDDNYLITKDEILKKISNPLPFNVTDLVIYFSKSFPTQIYKKIYNNITVNSGSNDKNNYFLVQICDQLFNNNESWSSNNRMEDIELVRYLDFSNGFKFNIPILNVYELKDGLTVTKYFKIDKDNENCKFIDYLNNDSFITLEEILEDYNLQSTIISVNFLQNLLKFLTVTISELHNVNITHKSILPRNIICDKLGNVFYLQIPSFYLNLEILNDDHLIYFSPEIFNLQENSEDFNNQPNIESYDNLIIDSYNNDSFGSANDNNKNKFTKENDIFMFGTLLLRIITNEHFDYKEFFIVNNEQQQQELSIDEKVNILLEQVTLSTLLSHQQLINDEDILIKIIKLALKCVAYKKENRCSSMNAVIREVIAIFKILNEEELKNEVLIRQRENVQSIINPSFIPQVTRRIKAHNLERSSAPIMANYVSLQSSSLSKANDDDDFDLSPQNYMQRQIPQSPPLSSPVYKEEEKKRSSITRTTTSRTSSTRNRSKETKEETKQKINEILDLMDETNQILASNINEQLDDVDATTSKRRISLGMISDASLQLQAGAQTFSYPSAELKSSSFSCCYGCLRILLSIFCLPCLCCSLCGRTHYFEEVQEHPKHVTTTTSHDHYVDENKEAVLQQEQQLREEEEMKKKQQRYVIQKRLSDGNTAIILLVLDKETNKQYVMKRFRNGLLSDFEREVNCLKEFKGGKDFIIELFDYFSYHVDESSNNNNGVQQSGQVNEKVLIHIIILEYCIQGDLSKQIMSYGLGGKQRFLKPMKFLKYAIQLYSALNFIHSKGYVHSDIKPQNILVTREGIKLADFGMAVKQNAPIVGGTIHYFAPEQQEGQPAIKESDIYSAALTLMELLFKKKVNIKQRQKTQQPISLQQEKQQTGILFEIWKKQMSNKYFQLQNKQNFVNLLIRLLESCTTFDVNERMKAKEIINELERIKGEYSSVILQKTIRGFLVRKKMKPILLQNKLQKQVM